MTKVWLITGASSGFGAALALVALSAGQKVIATARNVERASRTYPRIAELGGIWLQLDVTDPNATSIVSQAIQNVGGVDVIVNNAGYSIIGTLEDMSQEEIHNQLDTNFYGPIRVIQAALPHLRAQRSGTIVNISSIAGIDALPSCSLYAASKFALEGLSESLQGELAPLGIRVLLVEPGRFRTNFMGSIVVPAAGLTKDYEGTTVDKMIQKFREHSGTGGADPEEGSRRIFEVITNTGLGANKKVLRIFLGPDCVARSRAKIAALTRNLDEMEEIAASTGDPGL